MPGPGPNYGSFVSQTQVWDTAEIYETEVTSPAFKELLVRLYQNLNNMSLSLNTRDAGLYDNANEFVNGQQWFPNPANTSQTLAAPVQRQVYRFVVSFGALPNTGTTSVAHGLTITPSFTFTRIYGASSNTVGLLYTPIPNQDIKLEVNATNVVITTFADYSAYTVTYVILEYIKF